MKAFAILVIALLTATSAFAASAKFTANVKSMAVVSPMLATNDADGWSTVLAGRIHTATPKDLLIGVSLETSLLTDTLVKSSGGTKDTSTAEAGIEVKVLVDGSEAAPGVVVFDKRKQQLSAALGGYYTNCIDGSNGGILDGIIDVTKECELASEEIDLLLETTAAHHFNFIQADLGQGVHDVVVKAKISNNSVSANGSASASALLGNGSLSIEEVQAVNSPDGIVLQ